MSSLTVRHWVLNPWCHTGSDVRRPSNPALLGLCVSIFRERPQEMMTKSIVRPPNHWLCPITPHLLLVDTVTREDWDGRGTERERRIWEGKWSESSNTRSSVKMYSNERFIQEKKVKSSDWNISPIHSLCVSTQCLPSLPCLGRNILLFMTRLVEESKHKR